MEIKMRLGEASPTFDIYTEEMVTTAGWVCTMSLVSPDGIKLVEDRPVIATNAGDDRFIVFLESSDLPNLEVETYTWEVLLENASLNPSYRKLEIYTLVVEPNQQAANRPIQRGVNSFAPYAILLDELSIMPSLQVAADTDRVMFRAACIQAWNNIGKLNVDFDNELSSTNDFTAEVLDALTVHQQAQLIRAQLIEADFILGGNPIEFRRRLGLMSDSSGEAAHFFRPTKPVDLATCKDAALALTPYVRYGMAIHR